MIEFYEEYYGTDNLLLVIVGNFDVVNTKEMVEKFYANNKRFSVPRDNRKRGDKHGNSRYSKGND